MSDQPRGLAANFDALLLDLDGVLYIGEEPVPYAAESLRLCTSRYPAKRAYITNNASRTPEQVVSVLGAVGVSAATAEIVTSAQVAAEYVATLIPAGSSVLLVGGPGLEHALIDVGLSPVRALEDDPQAVVQGFHQDVGWRELATASVAVARGLLWVASNADMTIPTAQGIAPGNGTLVAAVATASGRTPIVVGKPNRPAVDAAIQRLGAQQPLIIGDRLDTDIEAANTVGIASLLVMTGVTDVNALCRAPRALRPTYVALDLRALLEPYDAPQVEGGVVELNGWRFDITGESVALTAAGSAAIDGLRALAVGCWSRDLDGSDNGEFAAVEAIAAVEERVSKALLEGS